MNCVQLVLFLSIGTCDNGMGQQQFPQAISEILSEGVVQVAVSRRVKPGDVGTLRDRPDVFHLSVDLDTADQVTAADWSVVGKLTGLKSLTLTGEGITSEAIRAIGGSKSITRLTIFDTMVDDEVFHHVAKFPKLVTLDVRYARVTGRGVAALKDNLSLRRLIFGGTDIDSQGLKDIAELVMIERLNLWQTRVKASDLPLLARMKRLKVVDLSRNNLTADDLAKVAWPDTIERVHISWSNDQVIRFRVPTVKEINLNLTQLSDEAFATLCRQQSELESFRLQGTEGLSDAVIEDLIRLKNLKAVYFWPGKGITSKAMRQLKADRPDVRVYSTRP